MENYTITSISRFDNVSKKTGKPYTRVILTVKEKGDTKLSGFGNKVNQNWREGDIVNINIIQNGEYFNFEMPKKKDISADLEAIYNVMFDMSNKINKIMDFIVGDEAKIDLSDDEPPEEEEPALL